MDGRFTSRDDTPNGQRAADSCQLPAGVPPYHHRFIPNQALSVVTPQALHSHQDSGPGAMTSQVKSYKIKKPDRCRRANSRTFSLPHASQDQLERHAQHVHSGCGGVTRLGHAPMDGSEHLDASLHLSGAGGFSDFGPSTADMMPSYPNSFVAGASGFNPEMEPHLPGDHGSPISSSCDNAIARAKVHNPLSLSAADVVMKMFASVKIESSLCRRLADESACRQPVQRRGDQKLNIERRSNVEALLAHVTGMIASQPCKNCRKGHGPWTECVVYAGQMCGSCTNCWYNASGARCTFQENNNPQPQLYATGMANPSGLSSLLNSSQAPSNMPLPAGAITAPLLADTDQWGISASARQMICRVMETGPMTFSSRRERHIARIEATAQQLLVLVAEYEEYLQSPEGRVDQQQSELQQAMMAQHAQQAQRGDVSLDESSPVRHFVVNDDE